LKIYPEVYKVIPVPMSSVCNIIVYDIIPIHCGVYFIYMFGGWRKWLFSFCPSHILLLILCRYNILNGRLPIWLYRSIEIFANFGHLLYKHDDILYSSNEPQAPCTSKNYIIFYPRLICCIKTRRLLSSGNFTAVRTGSKIVLSLRRTAF